MATKLAGEMLMITVCENLKRFTGMSFLYWKPVNTFFTVQGFHLFHWYSTERTITSKRVQSDSRQVIFLQRSDQRLN